MRKSLGLYYMLVTLWVACFVSCSSTQRITVKQEQAGQVQETVIESDTKVRDFSMVITPTNITYNGRSYRASPPCKGY